MKDNKILQYFMYTHVYVHLQLNDFNMLSTFRGSPSMKNNHRKVSITVELEYFLVTSYQNPQISL